MSEVIIRREGRAGRITLDRPKALNALTLAMVREIAPVLEAWRTDPAVELVILDGAGDRGLCAGGDVRWLYDSRAEGSAAARTFWTEEYRLDAAVGAYPKPFIPFMDGIVMGGGIGLSAHACGWRIVTERSRIAMPETGIGLIPDVGGTWILSRSPGATGVFLGLLGEQIGAADAILTGFADWKVGSGRLGELAQELCQGRDDPATLVRRFAEAAGPATLDGPGRAAIDAAFGEPTLEAIVSRLEVLPGEAPARWLKALGVRSPKALKLALAAIRGARDLTSLAAALQAEYRLCVRLYEDGEFIEGVRAAIIDKDRSPGWKPASISEVTDALVGAYRAALPGNGDLALGGGA